MADSAPTLCRFPDLPDSWDAVILPVDKPTGMTSFGVIRRLRRLTGVRKIGHAGTLDPMATGLLVTLVGRATRMSDSFMGQDKGYAGTLRLGQETPSYDADTPVSVEIDAGHVDLAAVRNAARDFVGTLTQQTPIYSAVRIGGERAYRKARRGESVRPPPRVITVHSFEITGKRGNDVDFVVECSKGTYVRSLAHELGAALGVGAHLVALRRTAIGTLRVEEAWSLDALEARIPERAPGPS